MPRKPKSPADVIALNPAPFVLTGRAAKLYADVSARWKLDAVAEGILRLACESMLRADQAAAIVQAEGLVWRTRLGEVRTHPACKIEQDNRNAAAASLQKLGLNLE